MSHAYTEDQLVEQPAIGLFAELGWQVALPHPHPGPLSAGEGEAGPPLNAGVTGEPADAGLLGRETKGEVVLVGRLRAALVKLNASRPVSTAGLGKKSVKATGHRSGHKMRQKTGILASSCLLSV